jgi:hypothetical protein
MIGGDWTCMGFMQKKPFKSCMLHVRLQQLELFNDMDLLSSKQRQKSLQVITGM